MQEPVHVRNLRRKLVERFRPYEITEDVFHRPDEEKFFLSRAVAALAITMETGRTDEEAAARITDCGEDEGIDSVDVQGREIVVVQSKWNYRGNAGFGKADVAAVTDGLRHLFNRDFERLGPKMTPHIPALTEALNTLRPRVTLVLALVTRDPLHPNTRKRLEEKIRALHPRNPDLVALEIIDLPAMYQAILGEGARRQVALDVELDSPGWESSPFPLYYGTVPAATVADWYAGENGDALTARNVRDALGKTEVNATIRESLIRTPEHFVYLNSGITLVADRAVPKGVDRPDRWASVGLRLEGASVINGAQTGDAVRAVMASHPECAAKARVSVRIISLEGCPEDFGDRITIAANTQNPIEVRDLRSVEPEQTDLREDFQLSLGLTYAVKRGEAAAGEPDCTMEDAGLALAAVHQDPAIAAEAKRDQTWLWEKATYRNVFGPMPVAFRVWRCVGLLRAVRGALRGLGDLDGVSRARLGQVVEHADLLLTHVLFHMMETGDLESEDGGPAWEEQLTGVPARVRRAVPLLIDVIDAAHGRTSQVAKAVGLPERAVEVVARLTALLRTVEGAELEAPDAAQKPRGEGAGVAVGERDPRSPEDVSSALGILMKHEVAGGARRSTRAVTTIVELGLVEDGTLFVLEPDTEAERRILPRWIDQDPRRGRALWRNSRSQPLVWEADGESYSPSHLVRRIRHEAMGNDQQVQGTKYWVAPDGRSLVKMADDALSQLVDDAPGGADAG